MLTRIRPCLTFANAISSTALVAACVAALAMIDAAPAGATERPAQGGDVIEGRYIVVYEDSVRKVGVVTNRREHRLGFRAKHRYRHALNGFSARLSPGQLQRLRSDPQVDFVAPDRRVRPTAQVPLVEGEPTPPTGARRLLAASQGTASEGSGTNVAVIDDGILLDHPDLNAVHGEDCLSPGEPRERENSHGTLMAGMIGAKNNGFGVVGVAPDAKLYSVTVLGDNGGSTSNVICGIDWVTANHAALGIGVANMSFAGRVPSPRPCASTDDPEHEAICALTAAGVSSVASAGNAGHAFDTSPDGSSVAAPAGYPEVLAVTGMSDTDGRPGGLGSRCIVFDDDMAWSGSSFASTPGGAAHTIAAPSICIRSTTRDGGHQSSAEVGTSGAAAHISGIVALCINEGGVDGPCAGKTPAQRIEHLRADAQAFNTANPEYGFDGDPLNSPQPGRYYGFLPRAPGGVFAPTNRSRPSISGIARAGETLNVSDGTWENPHSTTFTYSYQWLRCADGAGCSDISGATSSSYTLDASDVGRRLIARVTARDAGGMTNATSPTTNFVANYPPPDNTSRPSISGTARVGETLNVSDGTWTGQGPIDYSYQWLRCADGAGCSDISGATSSSYTLGAGDVGRRLFARVTAANAGGTTTVASQDSTEWVHDSPPSPPEAAPPPSDGSPPPSGDPASVIPVSNEFAFGKLKRNAKKGTAKRAVRVPGPGRVALAKTKQLRRSVARAESAGLVRLQLRPRGKVKRKLARALRLKRVVRVRVRARVTYRPDGGQPRTKTQRIRLVRRG